MVDPESTEVDWMESLSQKANRQEEKKLPNLPTHNSNVIEEELQPRPSWGRQVRSVHFEEQARHYSVPEDKSEDSYSGGSSMHGSYDGGGCCCGSSGSGLSNPILIAALGAATFFLFTAIQNAGRRRRRRRLEDEEEEEGGVLEELSKIFWNGKGTGFVF